MMMMGHTLTKRTNSALCTHSFKLVVGFPSQGRENCHPEWRTWPGKSLGWGPTVITKKCLHSWFFYKKLKFQETKQLGPRSQLEAVSDQTQYQNETSLNCCAGPSQHGPSSDCCHSLLTALSAHTHAPGSTPHSSPRSTVEIQVKSCHFPTQNPSRLSQSHAIQNETQNAYMSLYMSYKAPMAWPLVTFPVSPHHSPSGSFSSVILTSLLFLKASLEHSSLRTWH